MCVSCAFVEPHHTKTLRKLTSGECKLVGISAVINPIYSTRDTSVVVRAHACMGAAHRKDVQIFLLKCGCRQQKPVGRGHTVLERSPCCASAGFRALRYRVTKYITFVETSQKHL